VKVLCLTGGIGMGKSTAAAAFRRHRVPVFDADAAVHALQARGGRAVAPIAASFPDSVRDGAVDREALRRAVLGNPAALKRLEAIVHPLVRDAERRFHAASRRRGERLVVLDIPLLFETRPPPRFGRWRRLGRCDAVVVATAPAAIQRWRVLRRPGMTPARLDAILARQATDRARRRRADHLVHSGLSRHHAARQVARIVRNYR